MALIDEAKTWLRVSTDDEAITEQINMLVDAAIDDLTDTADIAKESKEDLPPLVKMAVMVFVQAMWTDDEDRQAKLLQSYDGYKAKLATATAYNSRSGGCSHG